MTSLVELSVAADADRWRAIGLRIDDGVAVVGGVRLRFVSPDADGTVGGATGGGTDGGTGSGSGLVGWALAGAPDPSVADLDGVPTTHADPHAEPGGRTDPDVHPLRPVGIDHVVVLTPSLERTCTAIETLVAAPLKRVRDAGGGVRQGFHRFGEVIIEVVEMPAGPGGSDRSDGPDESSDAADPTRPAVLWGLVLNVEDLHEAAGRLGPDLLSSPKPAVQPGRFIASFRPAAGLGLRVALMTP